MTKINNDKYRSDIASFKQMNLILKKVARIDIDPVNPRKISSILNPFCPDIV